MWRRKDTGKWYGEPLRLSARKLGLDSDETLEIIELRTEPDQMNELIDNRIYFPGYQMKKHWYTICLNGAVQTQELCERLDASCRFTVK